MPKYQAYWDVLGQVGQIESDVHRLTAAANKRVGQICQTTAGNRGMDVREHLGRQPMWSLSDATQQVRNFSRAGSVGKATQKFCVNCVA